jgi:hypothetical protein
MKGNGATTAHAQREESRFQSLLSTFHTLSKGGRVHFFTDLTKLDFNKFRRICFRKSNYITYIQCNGVNETPLHLFFSCVSIEPFIENMFKWFVNDDTFEFSRTEFFTTFDRADLSTSKNYMLIVFSKLLQKFVWDSKQRHTIPCLIHCKVHIGTETTSMSETSGKFRKIFQQSGLGGNFDI